MQTHQDPYPSRVHDQPAILPRTEPVVYAADAAPVAALTEAQRKTYQDDGFLFVPELFTPEEVQGLYREMQSMRSRYAAEGRDGIARAEVISERDSGEVRSIFHVHESSPVFSRLVRDPRLLNVAREILGSEVYIHQSRINYKPGFQGKEFYWHSDFETWHVEDGMPAMRALSCTLLLTDNDEHNGPLMLIPGSHREFIACVGATPEENYKRSLKQQEIGVPDGDSLTRLAQSRGIVSCKGRAGSVIFFDCNTMHGSNGNITPFPRSNAFFVYNSIANQLQAPAPGLQPRPEYIAVRTQVAALTPQALALV